MAEIRRAGQLPEVPLASPPPLHLIRGPSGRVPEYLARLQESPPNTQQTNFISCCPYWCWTVVCEVLVQGYLCQLSYNHTGTQLFDIKPHSSMISLMETARAMVRESLPIKCMEAATSLTQPST